MKFLRIVLPLAAVLLVAGAKKQTFAVRFYAETGPNDSTVFSDPIQVQHPPHQIFVSKIPTVNEHDITAIYPFQAADGTRGCAFKLDSHGRLSLELTSTDKIGKTMVVIVGTRQVIDLLIDRKIDDGMLVIPSGLTEIEIEMLKKQYPVIGQKKGKKDHMETGPARTLQ
jgi:hypothetical protein